MHYTGTNEPETTGQEKEQIMNGRYWALSQFGWGRGETIAEAVKAHDETVGGQYGTLLKVPVVEVPLTVWHGPEAAVGFSYAGSHSVWFGEGDRSIGRFADDEMVAHRAMDPVWVAEFGGDTLNLSETGA